MKHNGYSHTWTYLSQGEIVRILTRIRIEVTKT